MIYTSSNVLVKCIQQYKYMDGHIYKYIAEGTENWLPCLVYNTSTYKLSQMTACHGSKTRHVSETRHGSETLRDTREVSRPDPPDGCKGLVRPKLGRTASYQRKSRYVEYVLTYAKVR